MTEKRIIPKVRQGRLMKNSEGYGYIIETITHYDENEKQIPHYDGELEWYQVAKFYPNGMPAGVRAYGPNKRKALNYMKRQGTVW